MSKAIREAVETAIAKAETGEATSMTPVGLGLLEADDFSSAETLSLYRILYDRFQVRGADLVLVREQELAVCVGELPGQDVYLMAHISQQGNLIYLISPNATLGV
jgi:hypothetical protein